jgi:hypothetical protein
MSYYTVFCLVSVIITSAVYGSVRNKLEFFSDNGMPMIAEVLFPSKDHLLKHVMASSFFEGLSIVDLKARQFNTQTPSLYANKYMNSYIPLTIHEKDVIHNTMRKVRTLLREFPKLANTRWNFVKVQDGIENNYPHTVGDMIVLNNNVLQINEDEMAQTFIHEKIHTLQRITPLIFRELYNQINFVPIRLSKRNELIRSNPDLDGTLYLHKPSQTIPVQLYTSENPTSLSQSSSQLLDRDGNLNQVLKPTNQLFGLPLSFYCQLEHPAEITACLLTEIITNDDFLQKEKMNQVVKTARLWLLTHYS